ncbi:MAG: hypothetical protein P9M06_07765 [Candidatus Saelkia tenebricola]|nr:hypothetical protein [Candidatus Saelkia tenebricola]
MLKYALDIGSYSVRLVSGEFTKDSFEVKGAVSLPTDGYFSGVITNYRKLFFNILEILSSFEKKYSIKPKKVLLNSSFGNLYHIKECFQRNNSQCPISIQEIGKLKKQILQDRISLDEKEIFVQVEEYTIDKQSGIVNPEKMLAQSIELAVNAITIPANVYNTIFSLFSEISLEIEDLIPEIFAKANLFLTPDDKKAGVMLIDIGWGKVKFAVFKDGVLKNMDVFNSNLKSAHELFQSIYHLDQANLERVLESSFIAKEDELLVQSQTALGNVSVYNIKNAMEKSLKKILYQIRKSMEVENIPHSFVGGIVITGGNILEYPDLENIASEILRQPVRVEKNKNYSLSNEYSTSLGMLEYAFKKECDYLQRNFKLGLTRKVGQKLSGVIERYF